MWTPYDAEAARPWRRTAVWTHIEANLDQLSAEPHPFRERCLGGSPRAACPKLQSTQLNGIRDDRPRPRVPRAISARGGWVCLLVLASSVLAVPGDLPAENTVAVAASAANRTQLTGIDLDGTLWRLGQSPSCKAVAVVFLSTDCPISNAYVPAMNRLASMAGDRGIEFFGVISAPGVTHMQAREHREAYGIAFPVLFDSSGELRRTLRPTHTPQALVIGLDGNLLYTGRIDDRYADLGQKKEEPTQSELEDALRAVISGRDVTVPCTTPVGCPLEAPAESKPTGEITYHRDIAPILQSRCVECHREGESAPFPLLTYEDASRHARQMVNVTHSQFMPPWHPAPGFGEFRDERSLSDHEIDLIARWEKGGKPEGNPQDAPPAPEFTPGWRLGKPDLILRMDQPFTLPAEGPDVHQHFVLPTGLRRRRVISAIEFRPGNPRVVHHACFYLDTSGAARELDRRDPQFGYGSFSGPGFLNAGALRSWLPGMTPQFLPKGTGRLLDARSDIVLEIHYQCVGRPESDQSSVGIFFAEGPTQKLVSEIQVLNGGLKIPAGESRHEHRASYTLPVDAILLDAAPHMHLLGRAMKATATLPEGEVKPLIWIKDWDFNWQGQYLYREPVRLPKGTRIDVMAWYDNSAENPLNPHSPPRTVTWGDATQDEMGICHFRYTCETYADLITMNRHYLAYLTDQRRSIPQPSDAAP